MTLKLGLVKYCRPTTDSKTKFILPDWAGEPSTGVALHVTKEGETKATLKLDCGKIYYMFGRAPQTCDKGRGFVINNPTLSRQHAVFVHTENEAMYILDLDSAQGTFVNERKIPAYTPTLLENGNIVRFGQSTRKYLIRCFPKDEELLNRSDESMSNDTLIRLPFKNFAGLSVDDDDDDDDDNNNNTNVLCNGNSPITENQKQSLKQARIFTGLNARVSYPSVRSILQKGGTDLLVSPSISAADFAAAVAAQHSPAPNSMLSGNSATHKSNLRNTLLSDSCTLPMPALGPSTSRSRSLSLSETSPKLSCRSSSIIDSLVSLNENFEIERAHSYSEVGSLKRPAAFQMQSKSISRRKSGPILDQFEGPPRKVSFSTSPEFVSYDFNINMNLKNKVTADGSSQLNLSSSCPNPRSSCLKRSHNSFTSSLNINNMMITDTKAQVATSSVKSISSKSKILRHNSNSIECFEFEQNETSDNDNKNLM